MMTKTSGSPGIAAIGHHRADVVALAEHSKRSIGPADGKNGEAGAGQSALNVLTLEGLVRRRQTCHLFHCEAEFGK
jgi:hypothetical protein